jgi:hypothetical protein
MAKSVRIFMAKACNGDDVKWQCRSDSSGWVYYTD